MKFFVFFFHNNAYKYNTHTYTILYIFSSCTQYTITFLPNSKVLIHQKFQIPIGTYKLIVFLKILTVSKFRVTDYLTNYNKHFRLECPT